MSSVLESVEWGKSAQQTIDQMKDLNHKLPAVMHIRHSERPPINIHLPTYSLSLTERGVKTSYEYGKNLPKNRRYSHFHTVIDRSRNTASNIHRGILDNNGESTGLELIQIRTLIDPEANSRYLQKIVKESENQLIATKKIFYRWISGYIPPSVRKPSLLFSQETASLMMKKLGEAESRDVHIWVTHDNFIAAFIYHWFGEYLTEWITFLNGFILQFYDKYMVLFFRGEKKQVEYPYWWKK
jgi:hypothetical protein